MLCFPCKPCLPVWQNLRYHLLSIFWTVNSGKLILTTWENVQYSMKYTIYLVVFFFSFNDLQTFERLSCSLKQFYSVQMVLNLEINGRAKLIGIYFVSTFLILSVVIMSTMVNQKYAIQSQRYCFNAILLPPKKVMHFCLFVLKVLSIEHGKELNCFAHTDT